MTIRGVALLAAIAFVLLLAFASYLLDTPLDVIVIGATFAIAVILWMGSRSRPSREP